MPIGSDVAESAAEGSVDSVSRQRPVPAGHRYEYGPVVGFGAAAAGLLIFAKIASEVAEGDLRSFDEAIILGLRVPGHSAVPIGPRWLEAAAVNVTSLGSSAVLGLVILVLAGYFLVVARYRTGLFIAVVAAGGLLLGNLTKLVFDRPRPELVAHLVQVQNTSFPSGHATSAAAVFLTLGTLVAYLDGRRVVAVYAFAVSILLAVLVGLTRVYLGVHWPSDVLAGWTIGSAWALFCWSIAVVFLRRRRARRAGEHRNA